MIDTTLAQVYVSHGSQVPCSLQSKLDFFGHSHRLVYSGFNVSRVSRTGPSPSPSPSPCILEIHSHRVFAEAKGLMERKRENSCVVPKAVSSRHQAHFFSGSRWYSLGMLHPNAPKFTFASTHNWWLPGLGRSVRFESAKSLILVIYSTISDFRVWGGVGSLNLPNHQF